MFQRIIALFLIILLLAGCTVSHTPELTTAPPSTSATEAPDETTEAAAQTSVEATTTAPTEEVTEAPTEASTEPPTEIPTEEPTEATTEPVVTEPEHSSLYLPDVSADDMVMYFNEVCLDAEFSDGGNFTLLQRWDEPIYYTIYGNTTYADLQLIADFSQWLNTIEGFPGMYEASEPWQANMEFFFCGEEELLDRMGSQYVNTDGAFTFWYDDADRIYNCIICIRSDLDQHLRNSVILEEIYGALGPAQDTWLRLESVIYAGFSQPQALHPIDEVILRLLYHPDLACGMDSYACETIIRELYY